MSSTLHQNDPEAKGAKKAQSLAAREIFVVVDLEAKHPVCSNSDCKGNASEFIESEGTLLWYCKDHYFVVK